MRWWATAVVAAAWMVTALPAHAQRRECMDCHAEFKDVMKRSHVHQPAKESCETCHKRHGFTQKLVLTKGMPELCLDCHADIKAEMDSGKHVHGALGQGGCTACHDPHASNGKGLLRTEASQAELCVVCHQDLAAAVAEKDTHEPFRKGDCSACHAPHSSGEPGLLVAKEGELCAGCHKDVAAKHKRIAGVDEYACSDCHDPHRSTKKVKLAANAHAPFANGECESCHTMQNGQVTIGADFPPRDLCQTCHDDAAGKMSGAASHFGGGEMASMGTATCLKCHDPHVSDHPAMLVSDQDALCRTCHESLPVFGKHQGPVHAPFASGNCSACHDPHGSAQPHKLARAPNELCSGCHQDISAAAPAGKTTHAAMESQACTDCHSGHAGSDESLLARPIGEVCADCHEKETHRRAHLPYQTGECGVCHKNHSHEKGLLAGPVNETCGTCHADQIRAMAAASQHPPVKEDGCLLCHQPHGSEHDGLLVEPGKTLCAGCHDVDELVVHADPPVVKGDAAMHPPVLEGDCSACHDAHGSPDKPLLARTGDSLCFGCHAQEKLDFAAGTVHPPVAEGNCERCHTAHGSENGDLAAKAQPEMCVQCHDFKEPKLAQAHKKIDVSQSRCTSCHAPHASASPSLLNAVAHAPFADGDCETCHQVSAGAGGVSQLGAVSETLCFDCHDDKQSGKGHQHVAGVACVECHEPHSSPYQNLLHRSDKLCSGCHEDILELASGENSFVHKPIENGCQECHKLHDAPASPFLAVAQKDLCAGCHASVLARASDKTQHVPFGKGECSQCHETHVAGERHMLKTAQADLCQSCHDFKTPAMAARHQNMPLTGRACVTCHDPHSTKGANTALIYPNRHPPYADKDCSVCHDDKGVPTSTFTACLDCHDGKNGYANVHNANRGGADAKAVGVCMDCHSPHAGHDKLLVRNSVEETCVQCHDRGQFRRPVRHAALDDGCAACHDVHDNDMSKLRGADANQLCATCHEIENIHSHPVTGVADPRSGEPLKCISCHEVHSADHEKLLKFDQKRDLCVQCHSAGMTH